jgi:signal peptidase II
VFKYLVLIFFLIILDQLTKGAISQSFALHESKVIIDGFFSFTRIHNTGAAFGLGAGSHEIIRRIFFLALPVIACIWICILIWKSRKNKPLLATAYSLILSGAIGNLIDRFALGYVIDFFDFYIGTHHYPAFNIADSAITVGAVLLFIDMIREAKNNKNLKSKKLETNTP